LDAPFPLTPANSPRERENHLAAQLKITVYWSFPARSKGLPLLGERAGVWAGVRGNAMFELHGYG